jgi:mannose-1-phosphate guanylyltransferase/phosphomannomutase
MQFDRHAHAVEVANLVRASGAQVGAVIDPDGEHLTLVDDEGRVLDDTTALMALVALVSGHMLGDQIALPVNVTDRMRDVITVPGVHVRPTKTSAAALMDAASLPEVGFAASTDGGYILPGFLPAFDAAASLVKVLELLAREGTKLSAVVDGLPRVHLAHEVVATPWEQKGLVMRSLVEHSKDRQLVLVDGVKVLRDGGWALALPDADLAVTHVWAEAGSDADARKLAQEYVRRIRQMIG